MLVITTLNSQFIHSNLALKYLTGIAEAVKYPHVLMEFTINDDIDNIVRRIYRQKPTVVGFSCYIWNISATIKVIQNLKMVMPQLIILLGGPEVSFNSVQFMEDNPYVDIVISGEGESTFQDLLECLPKGSSLANINGLTWRDGDRIIENPPRGLMPELGQIPMPYGLDPMILDDRIVYYETSRGCPFNCSYCLSSTTRGVRYFPIDRVKQELTNLVACGVKQIKFVDRSFNCHPTKALELMRFLADLPGDTNFHFEIVADLLTDEMIEFLNQIPTGKFQFEIGIQSTNPDTLKSINRAVSKEKTAANILALKKAGNIHLHLDLIAGLPFEDYHSLTTSFNWIYALEPDYLQVGFLKLLKGSLIREQAAEHGFMYKPYPPYEVLQNNWLSYSDMSRLKTVELLVAKYYNSGVFKHTLNYCLPNLFANDAMGFYEALADYWIDRHYDEKPVRRERLYVILADFMHGIDPQNSVVYKQILMLDFVYFNPNLDVPLELERLKLENQASLIKGYLSHVTFSGKTRIEVFRSDVLNLAGINKTSFESRYYPVLFKWKDQEITAEYIKL